MKTIELESSRSNLPVSTSEQAAASSAHSRINVPLNLENWQSLDETTQKLLAWFHQHLLNEGLNWTEAGETIQYDKSTIYRVLKGTYEGNWPNIAKAIRKYQTEVASLKKLEGERASFQQCRFTPTTVTNRIEWILSYTLQRARTSLILGDGGIGKTAGQEHWCSENNHGRSVRVECMPIGGAKGLLVQIAGKVGVNQNMSLAQMLPAVTRAFNSTRILVLDEIQHHIPQSPKVAPMALEMARRIADLSGCALAMFGTNRVETTLGSQKDFYEQIIRRAGKPYYLPNKFEMKDVMPIITQFIKRPSAGFQDIMLDWSNDPGMGRLNYVVDQLVFASKLASDNKKTLNEDMVLAGHALREKNSKRN